MNINIRNLYYADKFIELKIMKSNKKDKTSAITHLEKMNYAYYIAYTYVCIQLRTVFVSFCGSMCVLLIIIIRYIYIYVFDYLIPT